MALLSLHNAKDSAAFVLIKKEMKSREILCQLDSENLTVTSKVCMLIVYCLFFNTLSTLFIDCIFISNKHKVIEKSCHTQKPTTSKKTLIYQ